MRWPVGLTRFSCFCTRPRVLTLPATYSGIVIISLQNKSPTIYQGQEGRIPAKSPGWLFCITPSTHFPSWSALLTLVLIQIAKIKLMSRYIKLLLESKHDMNPRFDMGTIWTTQLFAISQASFSQPQKCLLRLHRYHASDVPSQKYSQDAYTTHLRSQLIYLCTASGLQGLSLRCFLPWKLTILQSIQV